MKTEPCRLVFEQNVVAGVELYEFGAFDLRGEALTFRDWHHLIVARVQHQRWGAHPRKKVANVDLCARVHELASDLSDRTFGAELVEPLQLLGACSGYESRGENLAKKRIAGFP